MGHKTLLGGIINSVLGVFGLGGHTETHTDWQIQTLLTAGKYDKEARKASLRSSNGDLGAYESTYFASKQQYRKGYSAARLKSLGYLPSSTAKASIINKDLILSYIQDNYDSSATSVISIDQGSIDNMYIAFFQLQQVSGWSTDSKILTVESKQYHCFDVSIYDTSYLKVEFQRDAIESITDNLTTNYGYSDGIITVDSKTYSVGTMSNLIYADSMYHTICTDTSSSSDTITISTSPEYIYKTFSADLTYTEAFFAEYIDSSSNNNVYVASLGSLPPTVRTSTTVDFTALVPLKVDGVDKDPTGRSMKNMLSLLNLDYDSLKSSIDQEHLENAYIMYGIPFSTTDHNCYKALYQTFDLFSQGNTNVNISIPTLNINYKYTFSKITHDGSIGEVGQYFKTISGTTLILQWQISSAKYITLTISNFSNTFTVSGNNFNFNVNDSASHTRMLVPLSVLKKLKYKEFVSVHEESLSLAAFSSQTVYIEWYQNSVFQIIVQVVAVVLSVITYGLATTLYYASMAYLAMSAVQLIANVLHFNNTLRSIALGIAAVVMSFYGGVKSGLKLMYQVINAGTSVAKQYISYETKILIEKMTRENAKMSEITKALQEKSKQFSDKTSVIATAYSIDTSFASYPDEIFQSTSDYVSYQLEYVIQQPSFIFSLDGKYERETSVYAGV